MWDFEGHLAKQEYFRKNTDGAYELAMSMLRKEGGQNWKSKLAQTDIINICVQASRLYMTRSDKA